MQLTSGSIGPTLWLSVFPARPTYRPADLYVLLCVAAGCRTRQADLRTGRLLTGFRGEPKGASLILLFGARRIFFLPITSPLSCYFSPSL